MLKPSRLVCAGQLPSVLEFGECSEYSKACPLIVMCRQFHSASMFGRPPALHVLQVLRY